ncbi:MAG: hypothetical protein ACYCV0_11290, partial [Desulfitobacteriaceae bacterium]
SKKRMIFFMTPENPKARRIKPLTMYAPSACAARLRLVSGSCPPKIRQKPPAYSLVGMETMPIAGMHKSPRLAVYFMYQHTPINRYNFGHLAFFLVFRNPSLLLKYPAPTAATASTKEGDSIEDTYSPRIMYRQSRLPECPE